MLTNDMIERLARLVRLAPYMSTEQRQGFLELIRKLKAAEAASIMPGSAVQAMAEAVPDKLMRDIVHDLRSGPAAPSSLLPDRSEPVVKRPQAKKSVEPMVDSRNPQTRIFDAMVDAMVGASNDCSKLR